uniref:Late embryogenesis abundant protein LEA-2 subgroup domain-containing protein n=1 Tax=Manihot esculenta TaxID=3983 RepID=A0A2C9UNA1_MANES
MPRHPETNPHFIRLRQQREDQQLPTPPTPGSTPPITELPSSATQHRDRQDQPPSQRAPKQLQRSKPRGHGDGPFQAPWKQPAAPREDQHPRPIHDQRLDGEYHSPWMFPHHSDKDQRSHDPRLDGKYHSPWQNRPANEDQHPRQPKRSRTKKSQDQDHYPIHYGLPPAQQQQQDRFGHPLGLRAPEPQQTRPITWLGAALCAIFWIVIFLGGLIVLIVYLVYRPRSPWFEVSSVTLNAAYVDAGSLLNADISVLANFTNPNDKVSLDFSHIIIDLYYGNSLIATQYVESFSASKAESRFANVHMVTSQVRLPLGDVARLQEQINQNGIIFNIKAMFRVRSQLGSLFAYSNRLYGQCFIMVTAPPTGVLRAARCSTKR